jgi:hypothetical protein
MKIYGVDENGNIIKVTHMNYDSNLCIEPKPGYEDNDWYTIFCDGVEVLTDNRAYLSMDKAQNSLRNILVAFENGRNSIEC